MNIKILDSWLKDYLKTKATPQKIAEVLSDASVSVERLEKITNDYVYDIEVTTNRPDLMSVIGIAREATTALKQKGIDAQFSPLKIKTFQSNKTKLIDIKNDPKLVNRILAVVMEVNIKQSPELFNKRLEHSNIRSLNNLIDITNYVMRVTGHPTHVFDFDRLNTKTLTIREAKRGEKITTLDNKQHILFGGEIVAVNDNNQIVDLMGIMGLENSVVNESTKRVLFFIDNNEKNHIRKASMSLGIRTEAAIINEKGLDSLLAMDALLFGISLYEEFANGKIISEIIDIYPNKQNELSITITQDKINKIIGLEIPIKKSSEILKSLDFENTITGNILKIKVPSFRIGDIEIEEDIIEEIARIYGYNNIPTLIPPLSTNQIIKPFINEFYWEQRVKDAFKYWGFTEAYTYSFVSEDLLEGPESEAIKIQNPLSEEFVYMRKTLVPSLLKVISENKKRQEIKIFELSKIYLKNNTELPKENLSLAGVIKKSNVSFYEIKGIIEQLLSDLGINKVVFKNSQKTGLGASLFIDKEYLGEIEVLEHDLIDFEIDFEVILKHATLTKKYKQLSKYPPIMEDLSIIIDEQISTQDVLQEILKQNSLITDVYLFDRFKDSRSFRITYQDSEKNLTSAEITPIREKIISSLISNYKATIK